MIIVLTIFETIQTSFKECTGIRISISSLQISSLINTDKVVIYQLTLKMFQNSSNNKDCKLDREVKIKIEMLN